MILVYSKKSAEFFEQWHPAEKEGDADYVHCSDIDEIDGLMSRRRFSLVVIDFDDALFTGELLDVVEKATGRESLVVLTKLQSQPGDISRKNSVTELLHKGKLVLRRKHSGSALKHRDKVNIISETAATLSHEINNPLMAITANVEMLLKNGSNLNEDAVTRIKLIGKAADRIRKVTDILIGLNTLSYHDTAAGRMINLQDSSQQKGVDLPEIAEVASQ